MDEGEFVAVDISGLSGFMHETSHRKVRKKKPIEFLPDEVRCLAAQDHITTSKVDLQFVKGIFDFPSFVVKSRELERWSRLGVEQIGYESVDRFTGCDALDLVLDHPDSDPVPAMVTVLSA